MDNWWLSHMNHESWISMNSDELWTNHRHMIMVLLACVSRHLLGGVLRRNCEENPVIASTRTVFGPLSRWVTCTEPPWEAMNSSCTNHKAAWCGLPGVGWGREFSATAWTMFQWRWSNDTQAMVVDSRPRDSDVCSLGGKVNIAWCDWFWWES